MSENTEISWTDHTFNPWEGCQKVGPGCDHCYAETRNARYNGSAINWGPGAPRRRTSPANWKKPLKWNRDAAAFAEIHGRKQRVFCASLADVFDNAVDPQWRADLFALIDATPNLDWLLLTKRIGNVMPMLRELDRHYLPVHVWMGATIVNQDEYDRDIDKLRDVRATIRFISYEPALGPIDVDHRIFEDCPNAENITQCQETGAYECCSHCDYTGIGDELAVHWIICGGESGPGARPMHPDWARNLRDQCAERGVAFHFKQHGEWKASGPHNRETLIGGPELAFHPKFETRWIDNQPKTGRTLVARIGKKAAGRLLDGVTHDGFPA